MRRLIITLATCLFAVAAGAPTSAQVIRLGTMAPEGSPWHDALLQMREAWRDISGGKIDVKIYSGVLGDELEMIRKLRIKQLHAVAVSGAALPEFDPGVNALQMPLLLDSYEELDFVRDGLTEQLERRLADRGVVVLNWSDAGWVHFFTKQPVRTPADLRKLKLLTVAGDPDTEKLYREFGLRVVPLAYTDVLMGLETGLIEAVQGPPLYALLDQWFGLAKNMTRLRWAPLVSATVIRKDVWEKLPEAWRADMLASARKAGISLRGTIRSLGEDAIGEMEARGLTVIEPDEDALALWHEESRLAWPKLRERYVPGELFDEAVRLRDEFRSRD